MSKVLSLPSPLKWAAHRLTGPISNLSHRLTTYLEDHLPKPLQTCRDQIHVWGNSIGQKIAAYPQKTGEYMTLPSDGTMILSGLIEKDYWKALVGLRSSVQCIAGPISDLSHRLSTWIALHPQKTSGCVTLPGDCMMMADGVLTQDSWKALAGLTGAFSSLIQIIYGDPRITDQCVAHEPQDLPLRWANRRKIWDNFRKGKLPTEAWSGFSLLQSILFMYSGYLKGDKGDLGTAGLSALGYGLAFWPEKGGKFYRRPAFWSAVILGGASAPSLWQDYNNDTSDQLMVGCMTLYAVGNGAMAFVEKRIRQLASHPSR